MLGRRCAPGDHAVLGDNKALAGTGATFPFLNRYKRSLAIDLKGSSEGRELFLHLVTMSDVVIDTFAHGAAEGLGLGYDVLSRVNPRVIYLALKGVLSGSEIGGEIVEIAGEARRDGSRGWRSVGPIPGSRRA